MATIDGRPAQYGISLKQLRDIMEHRGREGVQKIQEFGGIMEICKKLYTSPNEGKNIFKEELLLMYTAKKYKLLFYLFLFFKVWVAQNLMLSIEGKHLGLTLYHRNLLKPF